NIERFDFGICMAAYDGKETIRTKEFDQDAEQKTFTLHRADNQPQFTYSMSRYEKITAGRYKGWSLAIPEEFKEYAKEHTFRHCWYPDFDKGLDGGKNILKPKGRFVFTHDSGNPGIVGTA